MANQYRIVDENGAEFISANTIASCAKVQGVSPKLLAEQDAANLNKETGTLSFRAERVRTRPAGF